MPKRDSHPQLPSETATRTLCRNFDSACSCTGQQLEATLVLLQNTQTRRLRLGHTHAHSATLRDFKWVTGHSACSRNSSCCISNATTQHRHFVQVASFHPGTACHSQIWYGTTRPSDPGPLEPGPGTPAYVSLVLKERTRPEMSFTHLAKQARLFCNTKSISPWPGHCHM